ncbi:restriction endonuclease subunit S [Paenibacillus sp. NPDC057886]|uniref:restriction endonuclease subunit S n=1 Tax=Paenibacillus sp. NPDC057886 TaxID=3346270 RepID=UPI003673A9F2
MLIKDCTIMQEGYVNPPQSELKYFNGEVKWLRAVDLNDEDLYETSRTLSKAGFESAGKSALLFKPNTLAVSKSGTIGRVGILKDFMCGNRAVINVAPIEEKVNLMYLFYWLISNKSKLESRALGSIQKNLYTSLLGSFDIGDLSLKEQESVVKQINPIYYKIQNNKSLIKYLKEYSQLHFYKWFVQFNFPNNDGLPYKDNGGEMQLVEGKMIPIDWSITNITTLGEIVAGGTPPTENKSYFSSNGIPWITPKDLSINKNMYISRGLLDISDEGYKNSSAKIMPEGTVLMSSRAPIGYLCIANNSITTNQGFKSIVPKTGISSEFIYYTLQSIMSKIERISSGSTFKEVSKEMMSKLKVVLPEKSILSKYNNNIIPISKKIKNLEEENVLLIEARDLLIKKLIK